MTATKVAVRSANGSRWWLVVAVLAAVGVLPLVGHGCHGDDVDHEPTLTTSLRGER